MQWKILIVEDDEGLQRMIQIMLQQSGYEIEGADNVEEALEILEYFHPDAICCDLTLPGENGITLIKKLRQNPVHAATPVVIISAVSNAEIVRETTELGNIVHLVKPFNQTKLLNILASLRESTT